MASTKTNAAPSRATRSLFLLALIFAVVAAVLVFFAVNQGGGGGGEELAAGTSATSSVVVAKKDIPARTVLTAGMLKVSQVPTDQVLRGPFDDSAALVGQTTRQDIQANEQVTASKVGPQTKAEREEGLSFVIPSGKRAFSIQVTESSAVGGLVLPGDLVDVIAIFDGGDVGVDKAVTLLQNVEVLAVAQQA